MYVCVCVCVYVCLRVCDVEASTMKRPGPEFGFWAKEQEEKKKTRKRRYKDTVS